MDERAHQLAALGEIILNGLHWEPERRTFRLNPTVEGATSAIERIRNIREDYARRRSGRASTPDLGVTTRETSGRSECSSLPSVVIELIRIKKST
jgi:hypothetical protein